MSHNKGQIKAITKERVFRRALIDIGDGLSEFIWMDSSSQFVGKIGYSATHVSVRLQRQCFVFSQVQTFFIYDITGQSNS